MRTLVVDRRAVTERGMTPMRVVPALDPFEDRHASFSLAAEAATAEQFSLERGKEALGHGIIPSQQLQLVLTMGQ